jgi:hypothetical protein
VFAPSPQDLAAGPPDAAAEAAMTGLAETLHREMLRRAA